MNLFIDSTQLEIKLLKKREYVEASPTCFDAMLTAVGFGMNAIIADLTAFDSVIQIMFRTIFVGIGIIYFIKLIRNYIKYYVHRYTYDMLLEDIKSMNRIEHPFSIIAIKDTFNKYPDRFLVAYDKRWDCNLFPYYRTVENDNESYILEKLSNEFKIPAESMEISYQGNEIHEKYSVSDQVKKIYSHTLYTVVVEDFTEGMLKDKFSIGEKEYTWMTLDEMLEDERIKEFNTDVVRFVETTVA